MQAWNEVGEAGDVLDLLLVELGLAEGRDGDRGALKARLALGGGYDDVGDLTVVRGGGRSDGSRILRLCVGCEEKRGRKRSARGKNMPGHESLPGVARLYGLVRFQTDGDNDVKNYLLRLSSAVWGCCRKGSVYRLRGQGLLAACRDFLPKVPDGKGFHVRFAWICRSGGGGCAVQLCSGWSRASRAKNRISMAVAMTFWISAWSPAPCRPSQIINSGSSG